MAGGDGHQRHGCLQLYPGGGWPDACAALRQDRKHRQPSGVPAGLWHRELRRQQGRPDRTHAVGRCGPRALQRQRQRRRPGVREDGPLVDPAARGARARRARIGAGAGSGAGGCGAGDRVPVQRGGAPHHGTGDRRGWRVDARFLKIGGAHTILRAVTNPLQIKSLVRSAWYVATSAALAARRAPGIAPAPDQIGTAILFHPTKERPEMVPDPLRSELRTLAALVGGGRYALVPAGLTFRRAITMGGGPGSVGAQHAAPLPHAVATAELTVVLVDVRMGRVGFRTVARGEGDDPWIALTRAVKNLTPGLP